MGHYDRPAALHLTFVECGLEYMAPIMFMRRMMRPTILQRETRPIASAVRNPWSVVILMHS
jgi:hypothetical protein